MRARLFIAVTASLLVVLGSPYTGQIRAAIQAALPGQYRNVLGGIVAVTVSLALLTAVTRIREKRVQRYGALLAAVGGGALYAYLTATGNADVDAVERFHLVEYGVLTWLYYRAWHAHQDVSSIVFPVLATFMVGTFDEGFQWLVPARVGELRDVLLNGVAIACGLVFSLGLQPLSLTRGRLEQPRRLALASFAAAAILTLAVFVHVVHLGYEIRNAEVGTFYSRYSADELLEASRERAVAWRQSPPRQLRRLSLEDHYLAEGVWHIQRRNEGDGQYAWQENLILEKYFDPVLEFPTYSTPSGARWPAEQRANLAAVKAAPGGISQYTSTAHPYPIYVWNRAVFWLAVAVLIAVLALACVAPRQIIVR